MIKVENWPDEEMKKVGLKMTGTMILVIAIVIVMIALVMIKDRLFYIFQHFHWHILGFENVSFLY